MAINIDTIIFDLGGVLIELGDFPIRAEWWPENANNQNANNAFAASQGSTEHTDNRLATPTSSTEATLKAVLGAAWLQSELVQAFETGTLSAQDFATQFIEQHQLNVERDTFITALQAWPTQAFPGATDLLVTLRKHYTIGLFSNINELHWDRVMHEMGLFGHFDHQYASHLIGRAKPATSSFEYIISDLQKQPEQILFLDDNALNVAAAASTGIHAVQVAGLDAVRSALTQLNLLPQP